MIVLENVTFSYGNGTRVFEGLDFSLMEGERVGICGPNGSGKTTLLHIIVGLLHPQEGEVRVFGKKREREEDFLEVRRKVGFLFQDPDDQLFCPTVEEDVAFGPLNLGMDREEARRVVDSTLDMLGISHLKKRVTYRLSGGEKRIVSLATVLAMRPLACLLDEPTTGLDRDTTDRLIRILREHFETYLIVSHDFSFLKATADRIYTLSEGRLLEGMRM